MIGVEARVGQPYLNCFTNTPQFVHTRSSYSPTLAVRGSTWGTAEDLPTPIGCGAQPRLQALIPSKQHIAKPSTSLHAVRFHSVGRPCFLGSSGETAISVRRILMKSP
eukprot:gene8451-5928_t